MPLLSKHKRNAYNKDEDSIAVSPLDCSGLDRNPEVRMHKESQVLLVPHIRVNTTDLRLVCSEELLS
jgi:hypothetical protein